jgi:SAM-dependent methyltransferase
MPTSEPDAATFCLLGCRAGRRPLSRHGPGRRYVRCQGCGLAVVSPFPDDREREAQYLQDTSSKAQYYERARAADEVTFARLLKRLDALLPARGRLLDVGCSVGTLMGVARARGWSAEGIEPNRRSAALAAQQGFRVYDGCLAADRTEPLPGDYRCVVMNDVLEHFPDPREAVRLAWRLLSDGGVLLILTPNLESIWARLFQLKPGEHLFLFQGSNLRMLLEKEGFRVVHLQATTRRRSLKQLAYSTTRLGPGFRWFVALATTLHLDEWISRCMDLLFRDQLLALAKKEGRGGKNSST